MDIDGCIKILAELQNGFGWKDIVGICALLVSMVAIGLSFRTARQQQLTTSASLLTTLANTWESPEMRKRRQTFALRLLDSKKRENLDLYNLENILDFFEEIGYLVKREILDKGIVSNHFFWHLERYYQAVTKPTNLILEGRKKHKFDKLYCEMEWLYIELCKLREQYKPPTDDAVASYLDSEMQLVPPDSKSPLF